MNSQIYFTAQGTIESTDYTTPQQKQPYTNDNYDFGGVDFLGNPGQIEPINTINSNVNQCITGVQPNSSSSFSFIKLTAMNSPIYDSGYLK